MHRGLLLIRSSIVACTNGKVNQATNMNATFLTVVVFYVIGTKYWDFSGFWVFFLTHKSHNASDINVWSMIAEENRLQVNPELLVEESQGVQL